MEKVAIFGGTFDPIHLGHLIVAQTAWSQLNLDLVIWVPTGHPPHKNGLAYVHRRAMVELAIANHPAFICSPIEVSPTGTDYAVKTFTALQAIYAQSQWSWIIGLDAFQTLPRWYGREKLIPACNWLVAPRPEGINATNSSPDQAKSRDEVECCQEVVRAIASSNLKISWQLLQMPSLGISSSLIRQNCYNQCSIRYLVPEVIETYIKTYNLYKSPPNGN
ncbi:MAG: nicotinate (nicotinamide) nucleotide adenylyltransferase [Coleofasciculaceae cyanobacterium]